MASERFDVVSLSKQIDGRISPKPVEAEVVEITVGIDSPVLVSYLTAFYDQLEAIVHHQGGTLSITFEELETYIRAMIYSRVEYVNNRKPICHWRDELRVPAFLSIVLENMGKVDVADKGLLLVPKFRGEVPDVSLSWMQSISRKLKLFENHGVHFAEGYSRDTHGEYNFMTLELMNNKVMATENVAPPVYALLAGTLAIQGLSSVLSSQSFRVEYADVSHLANIVTRFAEAKS